MKFAIVTINAGAAWGGSEVLWAATARRALKEGHEILVSMYRCKILPKSIMELQNNGAKIVFRRCFYPYVIRRLYKKVINRFLPEGKKKTYHDYILSFKPNHILFNLGSGGEIALDSSDLMVFIRQIDISYSIFCHELWLEKSEEDWYIKNLIECFSKAKNVFFTSKMILDNTQEMLGNDFPNFEVMNHPLQNDVSQIISYPSLKKIKFAMLGSLVLGRKGHDLVIGALSSEHWIKRDWELNIYGEGTDENYIRDMITKNGLGTHIKLCGFIDDLSQAWINNHIVLLPSKCDSGPIMLFETMLAGRAVIATPMGAMLEYVVDGKNGLLAKDLTIEAFRDVLEQAWELRDKWQEWGINAKNTILKKYDFDAEKTLLDKFKDS